MGHITAMHRFCLFVIALWATTWLGAFSAAIARAGEPAFVPKDVIRGTVETLERDSLTRKRLDGPMCSRWLNAFLDRLDPRRMYFLKPDDAEFRRSESRLGELAKVGDFGFPAQVRERYRKRVAEAASYAGECLSLHHDYSLDEEFPACRFAAYAADVAELRERWRLRIKLELLIEKVHGVPLKDAQTQLRGRYSRIARQARDMTDERLCELFLDSLAKCFDPHSEYWSPEFVDLFSVRFARPYTLGLYMRETLGEHVIASLHPALSRSVDADKLIGWHVLAIRRIDGPTFDLVEMDPVDLSFLLMFGLGRDTEVILELISPATLRRRTITWIRFPCY